MNKPLFAALLGGFLGIFDGLTALISAPETAPFIVGIVIGSTFKGIVTGLLIGFVARKVPSVPVGIAIAVGLGLFFAFLVAAMPAENGEHYYWQIMLPGGVLGLIVGYATYQYAESRGTGAAQRAKT